MTDDATFAFRLFIAGDALNSTQAVSNLTAICHTYLPGRHDIEVVDIFSQPLRALEERVFLTPTLIKLAPQPVRRIVGTLSQTQRVIEALGLGDSHD